MSSINYHQSSTAGIVDCKWQTKLQLITEVAIGTDPADPATAHAGPKFPVHQESPQLTLLYISCNQAN